MPSHVADIDTPAILIEQTILETNLDRMQRLADKRGLALRVHVKSHKIPELAGRQLTKGAVGIAVAKLGEAEIMADAGIKDIQVANIVVGRDKIRRLVRLSERCRVTVAVDSLQNASELSEAYRKTGRTLDVLVKVNTGLDRCGFDSFRDVLQFCESANKLTGIRLAGLMTHAGHVYASRNRDEVRTIGTLEGALLAKYAGRLEELGIDLPVVSVGSTPTAPYCSRIKGVTELRVGVYIFNDMTQVALGVAGARRCALTVLSTVISTHSRERVVIDAGAKAFGLDRGAHGRAAIEGFGRIIGGGVLTRLSEEHGIIENPTRRFKIGQKVRIIPNHACAVMNLFDQAYLVDSDRVIKRYDIAARGKMN